MDREVAGRGGGEAAWSLCSRRRCSGPPCAAARSWRAPTAAPTGRRRSNMCPQQRPRCLPARAQQLPGRHPARPARSGHPARRQHSAGRPPTCSARSAGASPPACSSSASSMERGNHSRRARCAGPRCAPGSAAGSSSRGWRRIRRATSSDPGRPSRCFRHRAAYQPCSSSSGRLASSGHSHPASSRCRSQSVSPTDCRSQLLSAACGSRGSPPGVPLGPSPNAAAAAAAVGAAAAGCAAAAAAADVDADAACVAAGLPAAVAAAARAAQAATAAGGGAASPPGAGPSALASSLRQAMLSCLHNTGEQGVGQHAAVLEDKRCAVISGAQTSAGKGALGNWRRQQLA